MISFIVPAHNEAACLGGTLRAIHESARTLGQPYEIVVADDASTDATAEIARQNDARVVSVNHRQIAATRNSGGRAAAGERLFFVDADTTANARAGAAALRQMDQGAAGGGAPARFDRGTPLYAQLLLWWLNWYMRIAGLSGGAFMFCTREAFQATGGFDERLFGAEDAAMSWALMREGRFVVLWRWVTTSSRRVRGVRGPLMLISLIRMGFNPKMLRQRSNVGKIWYDSNREADNQAGNSPVHWLFNALMLVITLAMISGPFWMFLPWSWTPEDTWLGKFRTGCAIFCCHIGLVLWPCLYFLGRNLFRQKRWWERIKLLVLIAISLWLAWGATRGVIWFWPWFFKWAAHPGHG